MAFREICMDATASFIISMIVLAILGAILHIVIIAYGVAYGLSIYSRWKREGIRKNQHYSAQRRRQEEYRETHPGRGRFYDGGIKYDD